MERHKCFDHCSSGFEGKTTSIVIAATEMKTNLAADGRY